MISFTDCAVMAMLFIKSALSLLSVIWTFLSVRIVISGQEVLFISCLVKFHHVLLLRCRLAKLTPGQRKTLPVH